MELDSSAHFEPFVLLFVLLKNTWITEQNNMKAS